MLKIKRFVSSLLKLADCTTLNVVEEVLSILEDRVSSMFFTFDVFSEYIDLIIHSFIGRLP